MGYRVLRYFAYFVAALIVLVAAAALLLPQFLDSPAVRAEIQRKLSEAAPGDIAWADLSIQILPMPRGVLREARFDVPGIAGVRAEEINAQLMLWPLLQGHAEVHAISVIRPQIRIDIPHDEKTTEHARRDLDPFAIYRSALQPVIDGIRRVAANTVVEIEDAVVQVHAPWMPPLELRDLSIAARSNGAGLDLESTSASNYWNSLNLSAHIDFATLATHASLDAAQIHSQAWLDRYLEKAPLRMAIPAAELRAQINIDANTPPTADFDLTADQIELLRGAERVQIAKVGVKGQVSAAAQEITLELTTVALGASKLHGGKLSYQPKARALNGSAKFDVDVAQGLDATRRLVPERAAAVLARFQPAAGRAQGEVKLMLAPAAWNVDVDVAKSNAAIELRALPAPLRLSEAVIAIDADNIEITRAALSMSDTQARVAATIRDYRSKQLQVTASLADGEVDEDMLAAIWTTAQLPPHLQLKAPLRVAAQRINWGPQRALDVAATAQFSAGQDIAVDLGWTPGALDIRRAAIKDQRSDATLSLHNKDDLLEGTFRGTLHSASIAALLDKAQRPAGNAAGDLRFSYHRKDPLRTTAAGHLNAETLDLEWLLRRPVKIDRIHLATRGEGTLTIREAAVDWAGQRATLSGDVSRGASGLVIDAQLDSPGINIDALAPAPDADGKPTSPEWWPLPLTGRIVVQSKFVQHGRHTVAPLAATLVLEPQRARIDLTQAQLCGLSLPSAIEATPAGFSASLHITAQNQQFEQTAQCLTGNSVQLTGLLDLKADLGTRGKPADLARNLKGTINSELRDGKILKFALVDNILSSKSVAEQLEDDAPKAEPGGMAYRTISVAGHFQDGQFIVDESALRTRTVGLAATGWVSVLDYQSRLSVLVAPIGRLDEAVRKVPIVGYVVGGALTSIPVGVSGDIRDPLVVPLAPGAVTSELVGIFERTLKLPGKLVGRPAAEESRKDSLSH